MPTQITENNKSYKDAANTLIAKYADMTNDDRVHFLRSAPYDLAEMLNSFNIKATVDTDQLEKFIIHTGISGGPRDYFKINIGDVKIELLMNDINTLFFAPKVLFMFLVNYHRICALAEEIKESRAISFNKGTHEYSGEIFYSDLYEKIQEDYKNSPAKSIIHSVICDYLRASNYWVHS
jgi:hypothetical protein